MINFARLRSLRLFSLFLATLLASQTVYAAAVQVLSNTPMATALSLPPNLVVTLDDSGSMAWAYAPDSVDSSNGYRRAYSSSFNSMYYNPNIQYDPPVNASGTPLSTSFTKAWINGFDTSRGWVNLSSNYHPTWSYNPSSSSQTFGDDPTFSNAEWGLIYNLLSAVLNLVLALTCLLLGIGCPSGMPAYYFTLKSTCAVGSLSDSCYDLVLVTSTSGPGGTDERQNFANWYSFYRTRNLAVVSSASRAFQSLPSNFRVAWQSINDCTSFGTACDGWDNVNYDNRIAPFADAHKTSFYNWLFRLPASGGTPLRNALRRVGDYYSTSSGTNNPYAEFPPNTKGTEYPCRQNYSLVMTDGMWNGALSSTVGNTDNQSFTMLPGNVSPWPTSPFKDSNSNSLSDVAFYYWGRDLRTDLTDNVPTYTDPEQSSGATDSQKFLNPKNDPANWQHMVTFTVGLGLTKNLAAASPSLTWGGNTYNGSYSALVSGTKTWPATSSGTDSNTNEVVGNVADLWHTALDSRGQFFSADDPEGLTLAFTSILNRVQAGVGSAAAIVANSGKVSNTTAIYQAKYDGRNWSGDLIKSILNTDGTISSSPWSAADKLKTPDASTRLILTSTDSTNGKGTSFEWSNLTSAQQNSLYSFGDTPTTAQARLNWLRGDATNEGTGLNFRVRPTTKLGDVINAGPVMVGMPEGGYSDSTYATFRFANCPTGSTFGACTGTRKPTIYFGANDGMVHGVDDASGNEVLAYVPMTVISNLKNLSSAGYSHQTYVDAQAVAGDAYVSGKWRSLLIGGLGAGGRAIYALNVTDPSKFNKTNANAGGADRIVYWEFTSADDADLGYTYGKPTIAKMANGKWAAIFGNGYNNTGSGKSALFIVILEDSLTTFSYKKITVGSGTTAAPGGLGTPVAVDQDQNGTVDYIYAGDIDGKLWKFDVRDSSPTNWAVASNGGPLFTAQANQPITSAPEVTLHPRGGMLVLFGTGQALQLSDLDPSNFKTQSFYGIWDNGSTVSGISSLEQRTFTETTQSGVTYRTLTGNTLDWGSKSGWYANLPQSGERVLNDPILRDGKIIFTTAAPSTDPCKSAGDGWLLELDAITGQALPVSPFDVNNDGKFNTSDVIGTATPVGQKSTVGPGGSPLILNPDCSGTDCGRNTSPQYKYLTGNTGNIQQIKENWGITSGRLNWRDIMQ